MDKTITVQVQVPEVLHTALQHYLERYPQRTLDQIATLGLSLFLLEHSNIESDRRVASRLYIDTQFGAKEPES
jgi:hypothetical protein